MEDGVPIALGPYGEPEMYYTPPVERMERIEVVKGSGAILYGPQTIGGVVNYITPQPPEDFTLEGEVRGGTFGYYQGEVSVGDTNGDVGYWLKGMHQRFDGHRRLNLQMTDATSKFRFDLGPTQTLSLKFNVYDEWSRSTYLGLTKPQYEEDPSADYAENDRFKIRRYGAQATHKTVPSESFLLETRIYGHNIRRVWRRQDFDRRPTCEEEDCYIRVIDERGRDVTGDESQWPDGRGGVFFRDSTGNRNREFTVGGIEPRATIFADIGEVDYELQTGTRFHVEHTLERRIDGEHDTSPSGVIRDDDRRLGRALAIYGLNKFRFFDEKLEVSPGLRFESLWTERTIYRTRRGGTPTDRNPPRTEYDNVTALIPGGGVSYRLLEPLTVFGGVHRGFSPPRTKDAITKTGERLELEPEFSWNYEAGTRVRVEDWLRAELAGFVLDFQNQIIAPAEAGGAVSTDPEESDPGSRTAVQGGQTIHRGIELGGTFDPAAMRGARFDVPVSLNYTFVDARFQEGWKTSIRGNELPYSPRHRLSGRVGFRHPVGLRLQVDGNWIAGQYTDKTETVPANEAGLRGRIDSRFLLDANVQYSHQRSGLTVLLAGKNLLDEQYIASRAPRGIKPGMFRHVYAGLRYGY
jgi:Fe(3+) dicitrate transport protein